MRRGALAFIFTILLAGWLWPQAQQSAPASAQGSDAEQLAIHRNLGKAFYENPTTQQQAVEQFQLALEVNPDSVRERVNYGLALLRAGQTDEGIAELEQAKQMDPELPHTWFNLGITFKQEGEYERAIPEFERMVELVPEEPVSHYNLGFLYRVTDRTEEAVREFEEAARLDPSLAGPHFQLYNAYRAAGRADEAEEQLEMFQQIRQQQQGAAIPEDLDWSFYSEIYEIIEPTESAPAAANLQFEEEQITSGFDLMTAGLAGLDFDADRRPDLLAWSANGVHLFRNGSELVEDSGLDGIAQVYSINPGDFDNDGYADLAVVLDSGVALYRNQNGQFEEFDADLPEGEFASAVWLDYDHDYDLDLILLGSDSKLVRNNGSAGFSDLTTDFPFAPGNATAGVVMDFNPYENRFDFVVSYADRGGVIYHDLLGGKYESQPLDILPPGTTHLAARDWNHDSWTDLLASGTFGASVLVNRNGQLLARQEIQTEPGPILVGDFTRNGQSSFLIDGTIGRLFDGGLEPVEGFERIPNAAASSADWNADGNPDLALVRSSDGSLSLLHNRSATRDSWTRITLTGVKNLRLAPGARVEVKAGMLYFKQTYQGVPLTFGLGSHTQIDTIRITWPNGLIQNEVNQPVNQALHYEEAQRLSGSCPMIFTWNGQYFQFITDVLGVAPLGASLGDGQYFPVDHDEYIQIPGSALKKIDEMYEIRITEELREVSYLDKVQLMAIDHPTELDIYSNDKFKGPPFPEFRLFGVNDRIYPTTARDHQGNDVLSRLLNQDLSYSDSFERDYSGVAELHTLDLDFGTAAPTNEAILVLNGWVDWADGSAFRGVSQESDQGLVMPYLQVKDATGNWQTVIEDMGMPAGKPKTIVVDLTGKFLSDSREVRIVTGLALYWDEIFLSEESAAPELTITSLDAASADLRFRGFSKPVIHPERKQPERFDYQQWMPVTMWNPTPGMYTRFGNVLPLVIDADDQLVVFGSGDELRLLYPADTLPPLPSGWTREFLLLVDGWAKDQDANTAFGNTVEPLPFHGMSQYPYPETEHFPDTDAHRRYLEEYNTRPALRLLRPLTETTQQGGVR